MRVPFSWGVVVGSALVAAGWCAPARSAVINVAAGDVAGLQNAVVQANNSPGADTINVAQGLFAFSSGFAGGVNVAVADINGELTIVGTGAGRTELRSTGDGFRFVTVPAAGNLTLRNVALQDFDVTGNGGGILVNGGSVTLNNVAIQAARATGDGGGIFAATGDLTIVNSTIEASLTAAGSGGGISFGGGNANDVLRVESNTFFANQASRGGAIDLFGGGTVVVANSVFSANIATVFGCFVNQESLPNAPEGLFIGNTIINGGCTNAVFEQPVGRAQLSGNTLVFNDGADGVHATGGLTLTNNTIVRNSLLGNSNPPMKQGCRDFGSNQIVSAGGNLSSDATCFLTQPTDQQNVNPRLGIPDSKGSIPLLAGSPAIDRGGSALRSVGGRPTLPCGYKDSRGIGRPQDGNNDGTYACDSGSYELQGGADLTGTYSAAYFDTARGGEGTLMEILDGGIAFVAKFTYRPNGGTAWFTGVGNVVGNSVVLDDFSFTTGGVFGAAFNSANVRLVKVGGAAYNFSTCDSAARPGKLAFAAEPGNGYEDLLVNATRLTSILPCTGAPSANAGRSGSFFSATRAGEGILVQFLPDGRVFLVWYTYDPQGNQFWIVSGDVTVNGNVVTAQMLYPATTTRFGSQFSSSQISLQPWGTVTLTYSGCDNLTFAYNSTVAGFGTGQYAYQRLTRLRGTTCS